jgi:uncharacterized membrane protein
MSIERWEPCMSMQFAVVSFTHDDGADSAFGSARQRDSGAAWTQQAALLVRHHNDRVTLNGTVLGHYVSADEQDHLSQPGAAVGGIVGGLLGLLLGPPASAAGIVVGAALGAKLGPADETEAEPGQLMDDLRSAVPKGSSAIVLIADAAQVDTMLAALGDTGVATRRDLTADELAALTASLRSSPAASPGPRTAGDAAPAA